MGGKSKILPGKTGVETPARRNVVKIHILFGQRKEEFPGQYAPIALEVIDELALMNKPEGFLQDRIKSLSEEGKYVALYWFLMVVENSVFRTIRDILLSEYVIPAHIDVSPPAKQLDKGITVKTGRIPGKIQDSELTD